MSKGKVTLNPENRAMEPISYSAEDISIIGKAIGVIINPAIKMLTYCNAHYTYHILGAAAY